MKEYILWSLASGFIVTAFILTFVTGMDFMGMLSSPITGGIG